MGEPARGCNAGMGRRVRYRRSSRERWARGREVAAGWLGAIAWLVRVGPHWLLWAAGRSLWWERRLRRAADSAALGRAGEAMAAAWLQAQGWRLIERNWRQGRFELDLIGWDRGVLVIVEVKTRSERSLRSGLSAVNRPKRAHLARGVATYLATLRPRPRRWRGEIVEITLLAGAPVRLLRFHGPPWSPPDARDWRGAARP